MTIRGNWDSKKGSAAGLPAARPIRVSRAELELSNALEKVRTSWRSCSNSRAAITPAPSPSGLKLAMSNKAGTWEYKFEASKEIPVLRFPVPDFVYNDPNTPFKLEAGLKIGAYFNAALMVTSNANELLPDRRRHARLLRPAVGDVRVAVGGDGLRDRPGQPAISGPTPSSVPRCG